MPQFTYVGTAPLKRVLNGKRKINLTPGDRADLSISEFVECYNEVPKMFQFYGWLSGELTDAGVALPELSEMADKGLVKMTEKLRTLVLGNDATLSGWLDTALRGFEREGDKRARARTLRREGAWGLVIESYLEMCKELQAYEPDIGELGRRTKVAASDIEKWLKTEKFLKLLLDEIGTSGRNAKVGAMHEFWGELYRKRSDDLDCILLKRAKRETPWDPKKIRGDSEMRSDRRRGGRAYVERSDNPEEGAGEI